MREDLSMRLRFKNNDSAVSPVIAVILMVAITVVLAATVYVWVSGFSNAGNSASSSIALSSSGSIQTANTTDQTKTYMVSSATPGMRWSDVKFTLDGATINCDDTWSGAADKWRIGSNGGYLSCDDAESGPASVVTAGQTIEIYDDGGSLAGKTLRVVDVDANSVIATIPVG